MHHVDGAGASSQVLGGEVQHASLGTEADGPLAWLPGLTVLSSGETQKADLWDLC